MKPSASNVGSLGGSLTFGLSMLLLVLLATASARADYVARTEVIPIQTMTLTDEQFLLGSQAGTPTTIAGVLRIPKVGNGRVPAVVLVHGSGGMASNIDYWEQQLNAMGIATFAIDDFSGRGIMETRTNQTRLGSLAPIVDAYRALQVLAARPWIDPNRIALMGFSRGGTIALYASLIRFQKAYLQGPATFAAYIPFYPTCSFRYIGDEALADKPIRIFDGLADDYVSPVACTAYVERLRKAGENVQITQYPGAYHMFDTPTFAQSVLLTDTQTRINCAATEESPGQVVNPQTKQPFTWNDACVGRGPHVGYNAAAAAAATAAVKEFLRSTFSL
jgi:dienelactone hydrolase